MNRRKNRCREIYNCDEREREIYMYIYIYIYTVYVRVCVRIAMLVSNKELERLSPIME